MTSNRFLIVTLRHSLVRMCGHLVSQTSPCGEMGQDVHCARRRFGISVLDGRLIFRNGRDSVTSGTPAGKWAGSKQQLPQLQLRRKRHCVVTPGCLFNEKHPGYRPSLILSSVRKEADDWTYYPSFKTHHKN